MAPVEEDSDYGSPRQGAGVAAQGQAAPAVALRFPALPEDATQDDRLDRLENFQQSVITPLTTMAQAALEGNALLRDVLREWRNERLAQQRVRRTTPARSVSARRHQDAESSDSEVDEDDDEDEDEDDVPAQAQAQETAATVSVKKRSKPVVSKVLNLHLPPFDGQKDQALGWLYSVEDKFETAVPPLEDRVKIVQIASALTGNALTWYTAYRKSPTTPRWLVKYKNFRGEFLRAFTDPLEEERAQNEFDVLRQTGSVTDYTTAFDRLRTQLGLGSKEDSHNSLLVHKYLVGLKVPIQRQLQRLEGGPPKTLRRLVRAAERIDIQEARIKDMQQHAQASNKPADKSTGRRDSTATGSKKSQPGQTSTTVRPNSDTGNRATRAESTPSESTSARPQTRSQTQSSTVMCYNCKKTGHIAKYCTEPRSTPAPGTNTMTAREARLEKLDDSDDEPYSRGSRHQGN